MTATAAARIASPTALKSATSRSPAKSRFDDDEDVAAPPAKGGFLAGNPSRTIIVATLILSVTIAIVGLLAGRYEVVPQMRTENGIVYRLDRLTGHLSFCSPAACTAIVEGDNGR